MIEIGPGKRTSTIVSLPVNMWHVEVGGVLNNAFDCLHCRSNTIYTRHSPAAVTKFMVDTDHPGGLGGHISVQHHADIFFLLLKVPLPV